MVAATSRADAATGNPDRLVLPRRGSTIRRLLMRARDESGPASKGTSQRSRENFSRTPSPNLSVPRLDYGRNVLVAVLIATAIGALAVLVWLVTDVLLLVFGAVLIASILRAIGDPIVRWTALSPRLAVPCAGFVVVFFLGAAMWLFEAQIASELVTAVQAMQTAFPDVGEWLGVPELPSYVAEALQRATSSGMLGKVTMVGATALQVLTSFFIVVFGGVYLALEPAVYRDGFVKLFPSEAREQLQTTLNMAGGALKRWLMGQLLAMIVTGALVWLALWAIGVPSPVGLALIAGFAEFVPVLGAFLGAAPALVIAASGGLETLAWTAAAFVVVQQIESNVIQPLIARESVSIPPAVLLFAVVIFGVLFGVLGLLFAAPLTVVIFVAVKNLYVRDTLGEETDIPGEKRSSS
jgi:predicted PurR-regulated permease PerM